MAGSNPSLWLLTARFRAKLDAVSGMKCCGLHTQTHASVQFI